MRVAKRGVHDLKGVPRIWRPRVCFQHHYQPPHVKPVKWRPGVMSDAERDLEGTFKSVTRFRKARERRIEREMYAGLGPPMVGNYQADAAVAELTTPQQKVFREELKRTRDNVKYLPYPPWDPAKPPAHSGPVSARGAPREKMFMPKKPSTPEACSRGSTHTDISLDNAMYRKFRRSQAENQLQRGQASAAKTHARLRL